MLSLNFIGFAAIQTARLSLRKIRIEDVDQFYLLRTDENALQYLQKHKPKNKEELIPLIESITDNFEQNKAITLAITTVADDKLIGTIGFWRIDCANYRAEIGYALLPNYQQQGMMNEAMLAFLAYGYNEMKLHSIIANVHPQNEASIKLLLKNGFKQEAYFTEDFYFDGKFYDSAIFCKVNK